MFIICINGNINSFKIIFSVELQGNLVKPVGQKPIPSDPEFKAQHPGAYNTQNAHHGYKKRDKVKGDLSLVYIYIYTPKGKDMGHFGLIL